MLTGKPEKDQPEARRGFPNAGFVDSWNFMFDDLHKRNYVTSYSEEDGHTDLGTFHFRLKGFEKVPTVYFPRRLWREMKDWVYNEISCPHRFHQKYIREFFDAHIDYNKFGLILHNVLHGGLDRAENADQDTVDFLKDIQNSLHGENTVVVVMGDHGLRTSDYRATLTGKLEERLPMLSITYPPKLKAFTTEVKNLRENAQLLTSHFDLYATFQHLSTFPQLQEDVHRHKYGRSLFTDIGKLNRTCAEAGVDKHWCTCLEYQHVDVTTDKYVRQLVNMAIKFINDQNERLAPGKCQPLRFKSVTNAGRHAPNTEVNQFKHTKTNKGGCDSCQVEYDTSKKPSTFVYEVTFLTYPETFERHVVAFEAGGLVLASSGLFESREDIKIGSDISRINLYGSQPDCIAAQYPHLRSFCFCNDFKEGSR